MPLGHGHPVPQTLSPHICVVPTPHHEMCGAHTNVVEEFGALPRGGAGAWNNYSKIRAHQLYDPFDARESDFLQLYVQSTAVSYLG